MLEDLTIQGHPNIVEPPGGLLGPLHSSDVTPPPPTATIAGKGSPPSRFFRQSDQPHSSEGIGVRNILKQDQMRVSDGHSFHQAGRVVSPQRPLPHPTKIRCVARSTRHQPHTVYTTVYWVRNAHMHTTDLRLWTHGSSFIIHYRMARSGKAVFDAAKPKQS